MTAALPDGQSVRVWIGVPEDSYIAKRDLDTVDIELTLVGGNHLAAVNTVLDKGQADASIVFTSDAQLSANPDKYVLLQDDKGIFPSGNVIWVTDQSTVQKAGPDYQATIQKVQKGLTLPVIQELNARVDIDKQDPAAVATEYLKEDGYIQ